VGNGLLSELGPFYPDGSVNNTYLSLNENSWIKEANIIFLESPVQVGFSYSNTSSDYDHHTDQRTAEDALQFLLNWYKKFPEYKTNELYLTGESYAGHYLPTLAREIVWYNDAQGNTQGGSQVNFKGWLVGNPWTDAYYNNLGAMDWLQTHDFISDELHTGIIQNCDLAHDFGLPFSDDPNTLCKEVLNKSSDLFYLGFIDNYNVYAPGCNEPNSQAGTLLGKRRSLMASQAAASASKDPCAPDLVTPYLNRSDVQAALHVQSKVVWESCGIDDKDYSHKEKVQSMLPIYKELMARGLRIWIYHGDGDSVCPTTATRYALKSMKLDVLTPWYAWECDNDLGGFAEIYKGLTFVTVRDELV
jgi:hypothetical protein